MQRVFKPTRQRAYTNSSVVSLSKNKDGKCFTNETLADDYSKKMDGEKDLTLQSKTAGNSPIREKSSLERTRHQAFKSIFSHKMVNPTIKNLKNFKEVLQKKMRSQ